MTTTRQNVLSFIRDFMKDHGYSPTYLEMAEAVGVASVNSIQKHVVALERTGYITLPGTRITGRIKLISPAPDGWKEPSA